MTDGLNVMTVTFFALGLRSYLNHSCNPFIYLNSYCSAMHGSVGVFNKAQKNDAILKLRSYEDASLAYTVFNHHASDTRIGMMDSTMPVEAVVGV